MKYPESVVAFKRKHPDMYAAIVGLLEAEWRVSDFVNKASWAGIVLKLDVGCYEKILDLLGVPEDDSDYRCTHDVDDAEDMGYSRDWFYEVYFTLQRNPDGIIDFILRSIAEQERWKSQK